MTTPAVTASPPSAKTFSATNTHTLAFASVLTLGSGRYVAIRSDNNSDILSSLVGSTTGAYTRLLSQGNAASTFRGYLYYAENGASGSETLTATTTTTGHTLRWGGAEATGILAAASAESSPASAQFASGTSITTGSISTSASNSLVIAVCMTDSGATSFAPAGTETEQFEVDTRLQLQTYIKAASGATTSGWTLGSAQPGVYLFAAFKADTGSTPAINWTQYQTVQHPLIRF